MIGGWRFGLGLGGVAGATTRRRAVVGVFAVDTAASEVPYSSFPSET